MAERSDNMHKSTFECVDKDPDYIPGEAADHDEALFYFTRAVCDQGLLCPPYIDNKAITCVVCTQ